MKRAMFSLIIVTERPCPIVYLTMLEAFEKRRWNAAGLAGIHSLSEKTVRPSA